MPFKEVSTKRIEVNLPAESGGDNIATVLCSEDNKMVAFVINNRTIIKMNKSAGIKSAQPHLPPIFAKMLGEALMRGAELAEAAWKDQSQS